MKHYNQSPARITSLTITEIFVFGSNMQGRHGKGAAAIAFHKFGARLGVPYGLQGQCFAIPTKSDPYHSLSIQAIEIYVHQFINYAMMFNEYQYLVTEIGCGLAGYLPINIAPLFKESPSNVYLPKSFIEVLNNMQQCQITTITKTLFT